MSDTSQPLRAVGIARPIRVAYLVNPAPPGEILDAIFAEAYGRWGGRRTLIVPSTPAGIDDRYAGWLGYFDPDVIYSFVPLSDDAVLAIHERYAPAHLVHHADRSPPSSSVSMPVPGLYSLSVVPVLASRSWGLDQSPRDVRILNKHWSAPSTPFLEENFGFIRTTFPQLRLGSNFAGLFSSYSLITRSTLDDPRAGKEPAEYVTTEEEVLDELGKERSGLTTLANLSEMFAPHLNTGTVAVDIMNIVVGDSAADRILFWNAHHRFGRTDLGAFTGLRVPTGRIGDADFARRLRAIIDRRAPWSNNRRDRVHIVSASLTEEQLTAFGEALNYGSRLPLQATVRRVADPAYCIPKFPKDGREVYFTRGSFFSEPEARATTEFSGTRFSLPRAVPWHAAEATPPTGLREGSWLVDTTIDRGTDNSRYFNQPQSWNLPRRIRVDRSFQIEREPDSDRDHHERVARPREEESWQSP